MLISAVHTEHGEEKLHLIMVDDAIPLTQSWADPIFETEPPCIPPECRGGFCAAVIYLPSRSATTRSDFDAGGA